MLHGLEEFGWNLILKESVGIKYAMCDQHVKTKLCLNSIIYVTVHHKPPVKSAFFILRYRAKYMEKLYSDEIEILTDLKCSYLS